MNKFILCTTLAIASASTCLAADTAYKRIDLADLKVDIKTLFGKNVETTGKLQVMGNLDMVMLKTDEFDMAPVFVGGNDLPREDKKKLLNGCQMILCKATLSGRIKNGPLGPQLVADKVVWQ